MPLRSSCLRSLPVLLPLREIATTIQRIEQDICAFSDLIRETSFWLWEINQCMGVMPRYYNTSLQWTKYLKLNAGATESCPSSKRICPAIVNVNQQNHITLRYLWNSYSYYDSLCCQLWNAIEKCMCYTYDQQWKGAACVGQNNHVSEFSQSRPWAPLRNEPLRTTRRRYGGLWEMPR